MKPIVHDLRLSETLAPFGVGAIADVRGESLIAPDTSWWDLGVAPVVHCDRLLRRLGGGELREPPTHAGRPGKDTASLRYWRFPAWRFCERCQSLSQLSRSDKGAWSNKCGCGGFRVPMRYVAICKGGSHIQDVPWFQWAHRGTDEGVSDEVRYCKAYKELRFHRASDQGEGLASLRVQCGACRRSRPLSDLVQPSALARDGIKCHGRQPWQPDDERVECERELTAVQRGATGNYIADRVSALDIPEATTASQRAIDLILAHPLFPRVVADNGGPQAEMVAGWIAEELHSDVRAVLAVAERQGSGSPAGEDAPDLKDGEWAAFVSKLESGKDTSSGVFVVDGWPIAAAGSAATCLSETITHVGQVQKVREVRALRGFQRYSVDSEAIPADLGPQGRKAPVFPAIELFGEGVFLRFDEERLSSWEAEPQVRRRIEMLERHRAGSIWSQRLDVIHPRLVALHTVAHLLIRQFAFESGYASASMHERIYANALRSEPTAGVLVYTAAGDAQGTLGGLVRLGEPERLAGTLLAALDEADICSNDPVCFESDVHRAAQLNLSACHGCALVSETSCEYGNRLLDRQLVLGGGGVPGLLEAVLPSLRSGT